MGSATFTAGQMDRLLTIKQRFVSKDSGTGRETITWPPRATVWAARQDVGGDERDAAGQVYSAQAVRWTIRWRSDVADTDRVTDADGVSYEITAVAQLGRRQYLQLTTQRVVQP